MTTLQLWSVVPTSSGFQYSASEVSLFVAYPPNRQLSTKVRAFVDFLAERFQRTPYWDEATS